MEAQILLQISMTENWDCQK